MARAKRFETPADGSDLSRAVALVMSVLRASKLNRLADLDDGALPDGVVLAPDQVQLINEHLAVVQYLRHKIRGDETTATIWVVECDQCGHWMLGDKGTTDSSKVRCLVTRGCQGMVFKPGYAPAAD